MTRHETMHEALVRVVEAARGAAEQEELPAEWPEGESFQVTSDPRADVWAALLILGDPEPSVMLPDLYELIGAYLVTVHGARRATADGQVLPTIEVWQVAADGLHDMRPRLTAADSDALTNAVRMELEEASSEKASDEYRAERIKLYPDPIRMGLESRTGGLT